jgi:hypothetical protein
LLLCLSFSSGKLGLQSLGLLLINLSRILTVFIMLHSLHTDIQTLVVLSHGKVRLRLSEIRSNELWIPFDGFVAVIHRRREAQQLDEARCSIGVASRILRGTLDHLGIGFDCSRPVGIFELLVAQLASLLGLFRINVRFLFGLDVSLFRGAELGQNVGRAMLGKGALVIGYSVR